MYEKIIFLMLFGKKKVLSETIERPLSPGPLSGVKSLTPNPLSHRERGRNYTIFGETIETIETIENI